MLKFNLKPRHSRLRFRRLRERPHLFWQVSVLAGMGLCSASVGALLGITATSTPLLQYQLSPEDAAVFSTGNRLSSATAFSLAKLERPVNILVLGTKVLTSDLDEPTPTNLGYHALVNSFNGLADTMMLLRFDPNSQRVTVLSIPRDTLTLIEGRGEAKINEANALGGPALSARTVSDLLGGVPIDRYVRVNVQGIEKLVDALGGVTIHVPKDMHYVDDSQHLYINLKAGRQHLNGNEALQFLRFRYDDLGDIGRVQRQQALLRALVEQSFNPLTLRHLPQVISVIKANIDTNLSVDELMGLSGLLSKVKRDQVRMLMLPGNFNGPGDENQPSYWLPDRDRLHLLVTQYFDQTQLGQPALAATPGLDPGMVRVVIQDSTQQPQVTKSLISTLMHSGYRQIEQGEPWSEPLQVTRIIAQQGDSAIAESLRQHLGFGEVRIDSTGVLGSDVTIQLGTDGFKLLGTSQTVNLRHSSQLSLSPSGFQ